MAASSARIPVDPIVRLHVLGLAVTRFSLFLVALGVGARLVGERSADRGRSRRPCTERAQEFTSPQRLAFVLSFLGHRRNPPWVAPRPPFTTAARMPPSRLL